MIEKLAVSKYYSVMKLTHLKGMISIHFLMEYQILEVYVYTAVQLSMRTF